MGKGFCRRLHRLDIAPADIRLIVLTHTHFDHVGSLAAVKDLCGCPVAVHASESERLAMGRADISPGNRPWSRFLVRHAHLLQPRWPRFIGVKPDILIDGDTSLKDWGMEADILHTPGHTSGSLSILTADGHAFGGDLCVYAPPFTGRWVLPPFAEDTAGIPQSWQKVLNAGAKIIHPSHLRSFSAYRLVREVDLRPTMRL